MRDGLLGCYLRCAKEYRDDYVFYAGPERRVVVVRPYSARGGLFKREAFERNTHPAKNLFGEGLLRLNGSTWRDRRHLFAPPFRAESLDMLVPVVQDEANRLITLWRSRSGTFKPQRDLSFSMLRILGRLIFGFDFDEQEHGGRSLHRSLITLSMDAVLRHLLPRPLVWAMNWRELRFARRFMDGLCTQILEKGRSTPFMDALRGAVVEGQIDRATAIDEIRTFLVAGHETSATAIAWTLATLPEHPNVMTTLAQDLEASRNAQSLSDVERLETTARVVKEVMRLFPPVPISCSRATQDLTLGRIEVARGTPIDVCSYVLHRLPWHWTDAERFDPQRFLETPTPGTYFPFLLGAHTCLGARLAMVELPLMTARLVDAFDIRLPEGPPKRNLRLSLHPANLKIAVKPRAR
ncbi:MAG TPA: cytochrome P450, partial [Polyangium sp.]|nr:cytochrome P450 [Polyangium sp.]